MYDIVESGKRLRGLRTVAGKTQEQAAADMGISIKTYQALEQGQRGGSVDTLLLIAEYFRVSLDFLVNGADVSYGFDVMLSGLGKDKQRKLQKIIEGILSVGLSPVSTLPTKL